MQIKIMRMSGELMLAAADLIHFCSLLFAHW